MPAPHRSTEPRISRVSVIITCFNLERFVGEAIESVLAQQGVSAEVELIVVDDGSTDDSRLVIEKHAPGRLVAMPSNQGVLLATCAGLERATGQLIAFLDADDRWRPDKLARVIERFEQDPSVTVVSHDVAFIDEAGQLVRDHDPAQTRLASVPQRDRSRVLRDGLLGVRGLVWLGSAWVIRRDPSQLASFIERVSQWADARTTYQDFPLAFWLATAPASRFDWVDEALMEYRLHGANASGAVSSPAKMLSNARKGRNTRALLVEVVKERLGPLSGYLPRLRLLLAEYDFLLAAYHDRPIRAWALWRQLARELWSPAQATREFVRLSAITGLSAQGATTLQTRVRTLMKAAR